MQWVKHRPSYIHTVDKKRWYSKLRYSDAAVRAKVLCTSSVSQKQHMIVVNRSTERMILHAEALTKDTVYTYGQSFLGHSSCVEDAC